MKKGLLIGIFIIAFLLRFYQLGDYPKGFHRDEAFFGYNAYSLLMTGRDMSGNFFPLHLASYLYSPAGYSYLAAPSVAVFGLNEFSVRFPSAFFGALSIPLFYILLKQLFIHNRYKEKLSIIASVLFATAPWHINLSRTTTENTVVLFFILLGLVFFFHWRNKQTLPFLLVSFLSFFVTVFLYQAPRAFLPFFLPFLFLSLAYKQARKHVKVLLILFIFIILPITYVVSSSHLSLRIASLSLTSSPEVSPVLTEAIHRDGQEGVAFQIIRLFHNKPVIFSDIFLTNYFSHFSYSFLFTDSGYPDRYRVPGVGLFLLMTLPFLLYGFFELLKSNRQEGLFLLGWIILTPIGSALTFDDVPNLQRTLFMLPPLLTGISFGVVSFFQLLQKKKLFFLTLLLFFAFFTSFFFARYLHQYYVHGSVYRPWYRQDGYRELVAKVDKHLPGYKKAIITDRESAPTIFFLFYSVYDPAKFQQETRYSPMRDFDRIGFGKYEFSQEECPFPTAKTPPAEKKIIIEKDVLYVNSGLCDKIENAKYIQMIKRADDSTVFEILYKE